MKNMLIGAISLAIPLCAYSQAHVDTLSNGVELKEVVVNATPIISKADRKLLIPNAEQIKGAVNGVDLLRKLNVPSLIVSPIDQSIKLASSGKVDLRINGRAVSDNEIQRIDPATVMRVEYHDNPSLRYGDAEVVIDFIVKNPTSGGSYYTNVTQGLNRGYHDDYHNLTLNYKKSEFSIQNNFQPRWDLGQWRDNTEYFTRSDGSKYERIEEGEKANANRITNWSAISYCFTDPDKQLLWVQARAYLENNKHSDYKGVLTNTDTGERFKMSDINSNRSINPALDIYYQRNIKNNQLLMFNVVGTITPSESKRNYLEYAIGEDDEVSNVPTVDILTNVKGTNYRLVAEADYEKAWQNSRFTGGARYTGSWSKSEYAELDQESRTHWDNVYAFGEYWCRIDGKVDFTVGAGVVYNKNITGDVATSSFYVRPKLNLRYKASKASTFRLNFSAYGNAPSISQLTNVRQQIDNAQVSVGNAKLKDYTTYRTQLQYELTKGAFYGYLRSTYRYSHKPIMEYKYWEGQNIISSYANHKNAHVFNHEAHLALNNWKNWVSANVHVGLNRYIMHGNDYTHTYNNYYWNGYVEVSHWGWSIGAQVQSNYKSLWGESISGGESAHIIALMYQYKRAVFMLGCMNPFSNDFKVESENRNRYAGYKRTSYLRATQKLCVLGVRWNINWGRKHNSGAKRLNNEGSSESVKAAGKG